MSKYRILIVDDEPQIQNLLKVALTAAGYDILRATDGSEAIRQVASAAPDAVLLDLGLPDMDGKDALREIRRFSKVPVIVLSARDRESEKIDSLDSGADDYVEKPFGMGELMARLRTALRHAASDRHEEVRVRVGCLLIDLEKRLVKRGDEMVHLTPKEYDLLSILARHAGRVVTHRQILSAVWGPAHHDDTQYLRVFIGQLRAKIDLDPTIPSVILTEPGIGYRFAENEG